MFRRIAALIVLAVSAVILFLAAWPQAAGLELAPVAAQAVSLRGLAVVVAVVAAGVLTVLLVARPIGPMIAGLIALCLVFSLVTVAVIADRGIGTTDDTGGGTDGDESVGMTVLAWNTLGDAPGAQAIADLALETDADIVALPETTEGLSLQVGELMEQAGRPMYVTAVALDDISKARSTSLLTSADLGQYRRDDSRGTTPVVPSVVAVPVDGTGPTIVAAHPVAPIPGYLDQWREDLEWVRAVCTGEDVILAGDLNSTVDHYATLGNSAGTTIGDCVDAAITTGDAAVGTWPSRLPPLLGAPIDHVMATPNWRATRTRVIQDLDAAGSDHRPIVAHLVPAG